MTKQKKLVIVGDSAIAEVAFEYFQHDSNYDVVAFAVEREYRKRDELFGRPVVAFEEIEGHYSPDDHDAFVAIGFASMNRLRERLYLAAKAKGYVLSSYISSRAFVWHNVTIGDNCFLLENNVIQPFAAIGNNVTLWSGNHVGHHARIGDHVFMSSHVVLSGFVEVRPYCFLGVNATVAHGVTIGDSALIGAGATILKNAEARRIFAADATKSRSVDTLQYYGIQDNG